MTTIGLDEVGRGAIAGPVMVGAVATPEPTPIWWAKVRDSKKLSQKARADIFERIKSDRVPWAVSMATVEEVDSLGIVEAVKLAGRRAFRCLVNSHDLDGDFNVVVDGDDGWGIGDALVKADDKVREVSAASICAKEVRDTWMRALATESPGYGWERNVGYPTQDHLSALSNMGPSFLHRTSFGPVKRVVGSHGPNPAPKTGAAV